jgi:hypothetical protein
MISIGTVDVLTMDQGNGTILTEFLSTHSGMRRVTDINATDYKQQHCLTPELATRIQCASRDERIKTAEEDQQNEDDNIICVDIPGITTDESASTANFAQPSTKKTGTVTKTYCGKSKARDIKHTGDQNDKVSEEIKTGGGVDVVERHDEGNPAQKGKGKTTSGVVVVGNDKENAAEGGSQCTRAPHPTETAGTSGSAHKAMVASPQEPEADVQTSQPTVPRRSPVQLQVMIRPNQRTIGSKSVPLQQHPHPHPQQQQQHSRTAPLFSSPLRLSLHQLAQLPSSRCTRRHLPLLPVRSASCIFTARAR